MAYVSYQKARAVPTTGAFYEELYIHSLAIEIVGDDLIILVETIF